MPHPWDKRTAESSKAYQAFAIYRDLGVGRTLGDTALKLKKSTMIISRWSSLFSWIKRCAEYDAYIDEIKRKTSEKELEEMTRRHVQMSTAAQQALFIPVSELLKRIKADPTTITSMTVCQLTDALERFAGRFPTLASMERQARGLPAETLQIGTRPEHFTQRLLKDAESIELATKLFVTRVFLPQLRTRA